MTNPRVHAPPFDCVDQTAVRDLGCALLTTQPPSGAIADFLSNQDVVDELASVYTTRLPAVKTVDNWRRYLRSQGAFVPTNGEIARARVGRGVGPASHARQIVERRVRRQAQEALAREVIKRG